MKNVYLDNGATSYPKAAGVAESISNYITNIGTNVNRGAYDLSFSAANTVLETRELIASLFNFDKSKNVVFTKNITESMNVLIKGLLKEGDHAIVSSMEHNAVMRPLNFLGNKIEYTRLECNTLGELNPDDLARAIKANTRCVILSHASNVCGTILDLEKVGEICKEHDVFFAIDSAQTAGFLDIDFEKLGADFIGFTGHKSLLGPQGVGGFIANDKIIREMDSLINGGTGSLSDHEYQPDYMPDKYESGTLNLPNIYGLNAALKYLMEYGIKTIREKEISLIDKFLDGITDIDKIRLLGKATSIGRTGVISLDFIDDDNGIIAYKLSNKYGIMTRSGLHCAPSAHKTLGTFPQGTVRFSVSHFNTMDEIEYTIASIKEVVNKTSSKQGV